MDEITFKEETNRNGKFRDFQVIHFVLYFLFIAFLLANWSCDNRKNLKEQAKTEILKQCRDILSITYENGENLKYTSEYDLESNWNFSGNRIELLYTKGFFYLFKIESTFTNKNNNELKTIISSVHTCSGVPPHFLLIERTHLTFNEKTGKGEVTRTEVLDGGELTLAPTEQDIFGDVLYMAVKDDKQFEEFLIKRGFLSPQQQVEFRRIQEKTSKAALGQVLIEKGIFTADEWEHIRQQYFEEKRKDWDRRFKNPEK
jgi:hypothetical protein